MEEQIRNLAKDIYLTLGPGHSETVYGRALSIGLHKLNLTHDLERVYPIFYQNHQVGICRPDLVVESSMVLEIKCVKDISAMHLIQLRRYLRLPDIVEGLLINFGTDDLQISRA